MAYRIKRKDDDLTDSLRRIAAEQLDRAIAAIDAETGETLAETVHEVRKRAKKVRGLLRLVRPALPAYDKENRSLRDAARRLAPLRDRGALIEAYDNLLDHYADQTTRRPFSSLRGALTRQEGAIATAPDTGAELLAVRAALVKVRDRAEAWKLTVKDGKALAAGLAKTKARAAKATRKAARRPDAERLHEWRKRAKYHRYHTRLMAPVWPAILQARMEQAKRLEDLLGEHRDLTLLSEAARRLNRPADMSDRAVFTGLAEQRQAEILAEARPLADRLFAQDAGALAAHWRRLYQLWRKES